MSKNLIVKDNALINASYNLDLIEQRLILLAIVQARKIGCELSPDRKIQIKVSDYIDIYNVNGRSVYENIKGACATLFERQFTYMEKQKKGIRVAKSRWVSEVAYNNEMMTVDITFASSVIPLISMLERHFTSYELEQVAELNSKYSVRLYEMLIAWRSQGQTPMLSIEDIRTRLGVGESEYKIMGDFKKRVIDLAINEINKKTDIQATYEQHKAGRKIIGFTFSFQEKSTKNQRNSKKVIKSSKIEQPKQEIEQEPINPVFQAVFVHLSAKDRKQYVEQYSDEQITAIIERADEYLNDLRKSGKKPRAGAVYKKAFAENWGEPKILEQQEKKKKQEAKQRAEQEQREKEKIEAEKQRKERDKKKEATEIFETLPIDEQEAILDMVQEQLSPFFRAKFIEKRRKGEPAHKDAMANIALQKILFN